VSTQKPILSAVLLCVTASLTMGTADGCGGEFLPDCGDDVCGVEEDATNCAADCGVVPSCGDGRCGPDEACDLCPADCGFCATNDARRSAGCGQAGDSGRQDLTVTIRGVQRTYRVQFPAKYDPNQPLPLIFYFHWLDGTIDEVLSTYGPDIWEVGNASNEAAFVWPQGLSVYGGDQTGWDLACDGEDMEFFDAMLSNLADSRCIDLNRVFAAGFSFGADMSISLACCRDASVIRAVAPASGAFDQYDEDFVCPGQSPPSMRYSYGSVDQVYTPSEFSEVSTFFRSQLGCSPEFDFVPVSPCGETFTEDGSTVACSCKSYRDCNQPYTDCEFVNMGHTTAFGWREDTWDYFMSF
jgi:hypothetical protein